MSEPSIRPLRPGLIVLTGGIAAALTWIVLESLLLAGASLPVIGAGAWLPIGLLACGTGWLAWTTRVAVGQRPIALDPSAAVGRLRIARAAVLAGAVLAAGYGVLAAMSVPGWPAPLAQSRVIHGAIAVVASVGWLVVALLLERACRIPTEPDQRGDSDAEQH